VVEPLQHGAGDLRRAQAAGFATLGRGAAQRQGIGAAVAPARGWRGRTARRLNGVWEIDMSKSNGKTVKVEQISSPARWHHTQPEALMGLKPNRIGRVAELPDTPQTRGMITKVQHLVRVVEQK